MLCECARLQAFDGAIVILSLVEVGIGSDSGLSAFRAVRIFRIVRLVRKMKSMQVIIKVVTRSLPSFSYIALLLMLFCFIYSILGMQLFGARLGDGDALPITNFDSLHW